jgi:hypothetical protein
MKARIEIVGHFDDLKKVAEMLSEMKKSESLAAHRIQ